MKNNIFSLKILPLESVLPHEEFDKRRARPLVRKLKEDKKLVNPIIVADLGDEKYLQLDGMNRLSAFQMMKMSSILAQVIDYNDQSTVELASWCHIFQGHAKSFLKHARSVNNLRVKDGMLHHVGYRYIKADGWGRLCTVVTKSKRVYLIHANGSLLEKVEKLRKLVEYYKKRIVRDALPLNPSSRDIRTLFNEHPNSNMLMVFPTFTRHQIISVIEKKGVFPSGVTRHLIKRRCLNINVPLRLFRKYKNIEEQNKELDRLLKARPFRLYEEPTIYFE